MAVAVGHGERPAIPRVKIAIATYSGKPPEFSDDDLLLERLADRGVDARAAAWDDPSVSWEAFDLVVARSPWDYTWRHEEFIAWARSVGQGLENAPELIRWNSDKRYLADLAEIGLPVVATTYVRPGDAPPPIEEEVVVKPTVSGGARDTGRFGPGSAAAAAALVERITGEGRTAMIQPFLASVDSAGETAVVTVAGDVSHVLRKGALLAPDEIAPARAGDALGVAEAMYDPELVLAGKASPEEIELARRTLGAIRERFATTPLVARIDMLRGDEGAPVLLELEAIEPNLYFDQAPGAAERLADAVVERAAQVASRTSSRTWAKSP